MTTQNTAPHPDAPSITPTFGLIIIGDEIMSGKRQDKHMPKVIELMAARGLSLTWVEYVGDSPDHTRQCAGKALGLPLVLHPEAESLIRERMQDTAKEQGVPYEPDRADNVHRLNMGVFPQGARIIRNPYNKIPGFSCQGHAGGAVHFVPGFPVMAWPMIESVLDDHYAAHFQRNSHLEKSVIILGAMESTLTPFMETIEAQHPGIKVFSLPSVDHPQWGRHIELGVKGEPAQAELAYSALRAALLSLDLSYGPELVRNI